MAKNSYYDVTSASLSVENRSLDTLVYHPTKPVLDSELNGMLDILSAKLQDLIRSEVPSGWLDADYSVGHDNTYSAYGVNTTNIPNTIFLNSQKNTPIQAVINGWLVQVGGSSVNSDTVVRIDLPTAPSSGGRDDLVFLEVWKSELHSNSSTNKPSNTTIYKYGNTQYGGTNPDDEIVNSSVGFETTTRVQLQYRIRVVSSVDFSQNPEGMSDANTVYAQGGYSTPRSNYAFVSAGASWNDYGLYVAGDGSNTSKTDLRTVDGYVYAVPMFRVHRRNTAAYSFLNPNGCSVSVLSGNSSDRPDGLFYDVINKLDIEDLRHKVTFGTFAHQEILDYNYNKILSGQSNSFLTTLQNGLARTSEGLQVDAISMSPPTGVTPTYYPNSQIRYFSDLPAAIPVTVKIPAPIGGWQSYSTTTNYISVKNYSPLGTTIDSSSDPVVMFAESNAGPIVQLMTGSPYATWSNTDPVNPVITLGTLAGTSASGLEGNSQDLYVMYTVNYPQVGNKLTKPVTSMLKVENTTTNEKWGFVSVNDSDVTATEVNQNFRRARTITKRTTNGFTDYAYSYRVSNQFTGDHYYGAGTIYSYYINGDGGLTYIIPGNLINIQDAGYVMSAYVMSAPNTSVDVLSCVRDPSTYAITVTLPQTVAPGDTIRFDVVLLGGVLEFDERTQSITDMGYVDFYEINGNNSTVIVLDKSCLNSKPPIEIMIGEQRERRTGPGSGSLYPTSDLYKTAYYQDNQRFFCKTENVAGTSLVKLTFDNPVLSTSKITIALYTKKTLTSADSLCITYNYKAYKGITQKLNPTDYIYTKLMFCNNRLQIMSNGTGAINTATTLPKTYENILDVLPHPTTSFNTGNFTGTVHTSRAIVGGLYQVTPYNIPYTMGNESFMTMSGNTCTHGTNKGGRFATTAEEGEGSINKLVVAPLLEMVTQDTSMNCLPGELVIQLETNFIQNSTTNQITNSTTGSTSNTYDIFKLEGRPLYKVKNK